MLIQRLTGPRPHKQIDEKKTRTVQEFKDHFSRKREKIAQFTGPIWQKVMIIQNSIK
jgi:hypothetical protein